VWATDRDTLIVQGFPVTDAEALAAMAVPGHEACVEVPRGLLAYLARAQA
jgi:hypothetical protein